MSEKNYQMLDIREVLAGNPTTEQDLAATRLYVEGIFFSRIPERIKEHKKALLKLWGEGTVAAQVVNDDIFYNCIVFTDMPNIYFKVAEYHRTFKIEEENPTQAELKRWANY